jgi:hypothetical protein
VITEQAPNVASSPDHDENDRVIVYRWPRNTREDVIVSLGEFCGQRLADLRCFVADNGTGHGDKPTKKGISVRVEDLPRLREAVEALIEAANNSASDID